MSEHTREVITRLATLDTQIRALPAGEPRTTLCATYEALITALALEGYCLRRGIELPAA